MPEIYHCQRDEGWLAARKGKITASNAAACLGIHPYISRQKAWREITGNLTPAEKKAQENGQSFAARWGLNFEAVARNAYEAETGNLVTETGLWLHDEVSWLAASPDGHVNDDIVLECKCLEKVPAKVPFEHRLQCQIQMACTGRQWAHYWVWPKPPHTDGNKPTLWVIRRTGMMPTLILLLERFYVEHILSGVTPLKKPPKKRKKVKA